MTEEERELRERFARLRDEDAESAPGFARTVAAARESTRARALRWPAVGAATAAALVVLAVLVTRLPDGPDAPGGELAASVESLGSWYTPTDVLLDTPGSELLRGIPSFGEIDLWTDAMEEEPVSHSQRRTHT